MATEQDREAVRTGGAFGHSGEFPPPQGGWLCFHCGERLRTWGEARDHFGATPQADPGCLIKVKYGAERGLQMKLREVEQERDEFEVRLTAVKLGLDDAGVADAVERFRASRDVHNQQRQEGAK